jgi:hypothetical protein
MAIVNDTPNCGFTDDRIMITLSKAKGKALTLVIIIG